MNTDTTQTKSAAAQEAGLKGQMPGYRWRICALLFFATTLNYLDRHVISILAPELQKEIGWSEVDYSYIVIAFQIAYGLGVVSVGKLLDHKGLRVVFALAVSLWSLAGMAHGFARGVAGFAVSRFMLGLGEAANFPASLKAVSEWFPAKERALVAGIFNAGANVGIIVASLLIPWIALRFGWQYAFVSVGALGFVWVYFWLITYRKPREHPRLSQQELAYIAETESHDTEPVPWKTVLLRRETIVVCLVRFLSDPTWWFLLFWLPKFLNTNHGIELNDIGLPMITVYIIADVGSVGGGWLSSYFIKRGKSIDVARKTTMLLCALCVIPIIYVSQTADIYVAVALISLGAAAHTGWMANVYAIISDLFPRNTVGSVTGLATLSAVLGGIVYAAAIGYILEVTGSYFLIFMISAFAYLAAWIVLKIGIPKIERVDFFHVRK